jgi:hypothetical protein
MQLSHEATLRWIDRQRAWRLARKTTPIWARKIAADEIGAEFQTVDRVVQRAREGFWLCVGVAGEPWFQSPRKVRAKYDLAGEEEKQFPFDRGPHKYRVFRPKAAVLNWVAQVTGPGITGFFIRVGYDPASPLYSPAGGYVVKDHVPDPYQGDPEDVWLVQQAIFESTYQWVSCEG